MHFKFDPNEVQWSDGMVLSCHQFQQEQIRLKNTFSYIMQQVAPYGWGVLNIQLDFSSMQNNIVQIKELECILPDYSLLFYPNTDEKPIELKLVGSGSDQYVYCVVPNDYTCHEESSRYGSYSQDIVDINTGQNKQRITKMVTKFALTIEKPSITAFYFPIIKFVPGITQDTKVNLLNYDPPTPVFNNAIHSKTRLESILSPLYTKVQEAYVKSKATNNNSDFKNYAYWILRELWPLQSLLNSQAPNTFEVYQALVRLCASMCFIDDAEQPATNQAYKHDEIYESFNTLCSFIEKKIVKINNMYSIGLKMFNYDNACFSATIGIKESGELKVMMQFDSRHDFATWISNAVITSHNSFEEAKINRTTGCPREIFETNKIMDNKRCITVKIKYTKEYIRSNLLYIANIINTNFSPTAIYLLDD